MSFRPRLWFHVTAKQCDSELLPKGAGRLFALHLQILVLAVAATSPYLIFIQSSDCVVSGLVCLYGPWHRKLILGFSFPSKGFSCISSSMAALLLDLKHSRIRLSVLLLFFFSSFFPDTIISWIGEEAEPLSFPVLYVCRYPFAGTFSC